MPVDRRILTIGAGIATAALLATGLAAPSVAAPARAPAPAPRPAPSPGPTPAHPLPARDSGRVLVKFSGGSTASGSGPERARILREVARGRAVGVEKRPLATGARQVQVSGDPVALAAALSERPDVDYAVPERIATAAHTPDDPLYPGQWSLASTPGGVRADQAWSHTTGVGARVAVIDTGSSAHPDLAGRWQGGRDFISDPALARDGDGRDADPRDEGDYCDGGATIQASRWHGTHVAGIIAANQDNALGISGVAPGARVVPVRVLGACGEGTGADVLEGAMWAAGIAVPGVPANPDPARIINMSLVFAGACDAATQDAVDRIRAKGALIVAAAGNAGTDAASYSPGNCRGVLTVAASTDQATLAGFSNWGPDVDLMAPGGDPGIVSTVLSDAGALPTSPGYTYLSMQGTSMAAPHASGVAALALSLDPDLTVAQLEQVLVSHTRAPAGCLSAGRPVACGSGILDAAAVVTSLAPHIDSIRFGGGAIAGGELVTLSGSALGSATTVLFGGVPATIDTVLSPTSITVRTPAGVEGLSPVQVTTGAGTSPASAAAAYEYRVAPGVLAMTDPYGRRARAIRATGGQTITIHGYGFTPGTRVWFGGAKAAGVTVVDGGTLRAVLPAQPAGTVATVRVAGGANASPISRWVSVTYR